MKIILIIKLFFVVVFVGTLSACGKPKDTIAEVGDRSITQTEFNAYLKIKRIPMQNEQQVAQAFDEYLQREAMADAISAEGLLGETLLAAEINEYKKQLLISRYFEKYLQDKVSEQALKNYYALNTEEFSNKKAHIAHILIRTNASMSPVEKQARLTRAHEAYSKIIQGEDFATIAEAYSEDTRTAKNGGDLGWIEAGAVDPGFTKAAFSLKEGGVSQPVMTSFGYHIIKVLEPEKVIKTAFEKIKGDIRYRLRQEAKKTESQRLKNLLGITKKGGQA